MTPEQEKKWREKFLTTNQYLDNKDTCSFEELRRMQDSYFLARQEAHEIHMIDKEAMLVLYHLLKSKLGEFVDVDKYLDEHSEEAPEGFKYHAELHDEIDKLKKDLREENGRYCELAKEFNQCRVSHKNLEKIEREFWGKITALEELVNSARKILTEDIYTGEFLDSVSDWLEKRSKIPEGK